MAARYSRESLYERRAAGVFIFRAGLAVIPLWIIASVYLYMVVEQPDSALFGIGSLLVVPILPLAFGFGLFVSAVKMLRGAYNEHSAGLLRRQPQTSKARATEPRAGGSEMDEILRRYEQDFGN